MTGWPWTSESSSITPSDEPWPKVTVVTPSFNQVEFIEATIRSVLLQGYPNLEYIIIDGDSTDGSVGIIKKYEALISHWISESDMGQYDAVNKGFNLASGEIMTWLNSDDMYVPGCLWVVGSVFRTFEAKVQWITGVPVSWDTEGHLCRVSHLPKYCRDLIRKGCYEGRALGWIQQESTFWRRSLWKKSGAALDCNWKLAADFELWLRFSKFADLYSVRNLMGGFRHHKSQKTTTKEAYYREVNAILKKRSLTGLTFRIVRHSNLKRAVRWLVNRSFWGTTMLEYDPGKKKWTIT